MNRARFLVLVSILFFVGLISACKMTEEQIRAQGFSPNLLEQAAVNGREFAEADAKSSERGSKIQWFLLSAAILAGVVMVFVSDRDEKKKRPPAKRSTAKKRRKR